MDTVDVVIVILVVAMTGFYMLSEFYRRRLMAANAEIERLREGINAMQRRLDASVIRLDKALPEGQQVVIHYQTDWQPVDDMDWQEFRDRLKPHDRVRKYPHVADYRDLP